MGKKEDEVAGDRRGQGNKGNGGVRLGKRKANDRSRKKERIRG